MEINIKNKKYHLKKESFERQVSYTLYDKKGQTTFEKAGSVLYYIEFDDYSSYLWLTSINVEEKYQSMGLGQFLFDLLYNDAILKRASYIEGKYFPTNDKAKPFYDKNGCEIYKAGYETFVFKSIPYDCKPNQYFSDIATQTSIEEKLKAKKEAIPLKQSVVNAPATHLHEDGGRI